MRSLETSKFQTIQKKKQVTYLQTKVEFLEKLVETIFRLKPININEIP